LNHISFIFLPFQLNIISVRYASSIKTEFKPSIKILIKLLNFPLPLKFLG
jgi:hypothetical protein